MRKTLTILAFLAVLSARAAFADDDCFVPMSQWQPRGAVEELAAANGWTVRRIKIDDGCYEIDGRDRADRRVEVKVHPGTLQIVDIEYEDEDGRDRPRRSGQRDD
jgi:hypothetical protein